MTTTDSELLQQFGRNRSEKAFATLVSRHVDLVYSAALRQVRSPQLAEEVAQSVFVDLSRNADKLTPDTILTAWLYRVTRRAAIDVVRSESRRQLREQIAVELAAMNSHNAQWTQIEPLLDEAMETLDEQDRSSILLRYFENKNLREVGQTLGTSDDAAQKRVSRAVEKLREYFSKNGIAVGSGGFVTLLSGNAVQAAPIALSAMISSAAITGGTVSAAAMVGAGTTLIMTTTQKILITTVLAAAVGTGVYEFAQNSWLRNDLQRMEQKLKPLAEQNEQLRREHDEMEKKFLSAQEDAEQWRKQIAELPKLRGDVARLRESERELAQLKAGENVDPAQAEMKSWLDRVAQLKKQFDDRPQQGIPELQFLTDQDWMEVAHDKIETEDDLRKAASRLRGIAENKFAGVLSSAIKQYIEAHQGKLPNNVLELQPFLKPPADETFLQRYEIRSAQNSSVWRNERDWNVTQKGPVDEEYDGRFTITPQGWGSMSPAWKKTTADTTDWETLSPVMDAFKKDYGFSSPTDFTLLLPYATTTKQKTALERVITDTKKKSDEK